MKRILRNNYSVEIPENWEIENNETSDSVFDPYGKGALTISNYTNTKGQADSEKALSNFVEGKGVIETKNLDNQSIAQLAYIDENDRYIYASAVSKGNILVIASYNCEKENVSNTEVAMVKAIIVSIKID